jgi:hypothetical protein
LIQRRMEIDRKRTVALLQLGGGAVFLLLGLIVLDPSRGVVAWLLPAIAVFWIVVGAYGVMRHRREIAAFEAQNGAGAGRQPPVGAESRAEPIEDPDTRG